MFTARARGFAAASGRALAGPALLVTALSLCFTGSAFAQVEPPAQTQAPPLATDDGAPPNAPAPDTSTPDLAFDEPGTPGEPPPVSRLETDLRFKELVAEERFSDAVSLGPSLLELTTAEFGADSLQAAAAHAQVADAQRRASEYDAAVENYLHSIEVYRRVDGPFTPLAIDSIVGLGDTYQDAGDHLSAVSSYGEARTVSRRAFGLLNERQIPLLDRMTVALVSLNQHVEADQQQLEALRLVERNWPPHSEQALAATYKYAGWLRENGRYQEEREQYARALRVIRDHYGEDAPQQVQPLVGIGNSFRNQRIPEGQGVSALRDALALLLAQSAPDELAIAEVLRDLGDWEIAFSKVGYDGAEYRRAWQMLGNVANGPSLRRAWFTGPAYVLREPISQRGLSLDSDALTGHVLVKFDLDPLGRSMNVEVVESNPPGLKDESVLRHVRRSRFRPQMADGEVVSGTALALQFNYRYTPDETLGSNEARD